MNNYVPKSEDLTKRVKVIKAVSYKDSRGNMLYKYPGTDDKTVWAAIEPYGSTIIKGEAQKVSEVQYRITMRYRTVHIMDKLQYQGRIFQQSIPAVDINMQHQWLELTCTEVVKGG